MDDAGNIPVGIGDQTALAIENAKKLIEAAGSSLDKVLMCQCFIKGKEYFSGMNETYGKFFGGEHSIAPARYTVIAPLTDDRLLVEIAIIAGL